MELTEDARMTRLIHVNDDTFEDLMSAERSVLVIGRTDCWHCNRYEEGLQELIEDPAYEGITFGKLVLDEPGSIQIKRENPWIGQLPELPYTVLYWKGDPVDKFAASKPAYLEERLEETFLASTA